MSAERINRIRPMRADRDSQRGVAILTAMIIVTLVATLASALVWNQHRLLRLEQAERHRAGAAWILRGALDWSRARLRDSARGAGVEAATSLDQPWASPMAEQSVSTFLGDDRAGDEPTARLSGQIEDAQARYNLRRLIASDGQVLAAEVATLGRLCALAGVEPDAAPRIAAVLRSAASGKQNDPLMPSDFRQLVWLGIDAGTIKALQPYVILLPTPVPINVNTASRQVLQALLGNADEGTADRLLQLRGDRPFKSQQALAAELAGAALPNDSTAVTSEFFVVRHRIRFAEGGAVEQRSLVQRGPDGQTQVISQELGGLSS